MTDQHVPHATITEDGTHLTIVDAASHTTRLALDIDTLIVERYTLQTFYMILTEMTHHTVTAADRHRQSATVSSNPPLSMRSTELKVEASCASFLAAAISRVLRSASIFAFNSAARLSASAFLAACSAAASRAACSAAARLAASAAARALACAFAFALASAWAAASS